MTLYLNGVAFRNNPTSINWQYTVKMATTKTIGGKVIQIYGTQMSDLTISGQFSSPEEQQEWFTRIKGIVDSQVPTQTNQKPNSVRLFWPERQWDFMVFVKSFTQVGASTSISATNKSFAPKWSLVVFVEDDNGDIVRPTEKAAEASFLRRITDGMGWQQTQWNGPTDAEFQEVLDGRGIIQYLFDQRAEIINQGFVNQATGNAP